VFDPDTTAAVASMRGKSGNLSSVWRTDPGAPYAGHTGSVEDLQRSPNEATVIASCSTDGTVRIWDTRMRSKAQLQVAGAGAGVDVNVIAWSKREAHLFASGDDKGGFKAWDLRNFKRCV